MTVDMDDMEDPYVQFLTERNATVRKKVFVPTPGMAAWDAPPKIVQPLNHSNKSDWSKSQSKSVIKIRDIETTIN